MPTPAIERAASTPKRDHLLDTAFRLFYRHGYHAVGIDTILAEAKLAKMTLYHHFPSKEALIVAVIERRGEQLDAQIAEMLASAGSSPRKRLIALLNWHESWFASRDFNGCAFIRAAAEYTEQDSPVHQAVVRRKSQALARLETLVAALDVPAPTTIARQIQLLLEGAIVCAHNFGDPSVATQARDAALELIAAAKR